MSISGIALVSASSGASTALSSSSASGDTTSVTTSADGSTVTTVRDKNGQIVAISTTPPTRPPEQTSNGATTKIDVTA